MCDNPYFDAAAAVRFGTPDATTLHTFASAGDQCGLTAYLDYLQRQRDELAVRYAHAIPNDDALATLCALGPLVEIGAGTGYWAKLLRARGADLLAFDRNPPLHVDHTNLFHRTPDGAAVGTCWSEVLVGDDGAAALYADRALVLCWPTADLAAAAITCYPGTTLALIADPQWTDSPFFETTLRQQFGLAHLVPIPQWHGVHDRLTVWQRSRSRAR